MFGDGALTFWEFAMREQLPLATIHDAVLEFLGGRDDAVLFGAQAVNAYVDEPRMTQDVDIASPRAADLAEELRRFLNERFHIAVRVRDIRDGLGYRIYQVKKPKNRHLVDLRPVEQLPPAQRVKDVLVVTPPELIAGKVAAYAHRRHSGKPKAGTDWRDVAMLLLTFPELKTVEGPVAERLRAHGAGEDVLTAWRELVAQEILPEDEDEEFAPDEQDQ
jgi:Nucleotidyl transferase AbiEii toxin, Type IV TA system